MSPRAWVSLCLLPAGWALAAASRQPLPETVLEVEAAGRWSPPTGAAPALDSVIFPVWTRQNLWRPWKQWTTRPPRFDSTMTEAALVMATGARRLGVEDDIEDLYRENPDGSRAPFDTSHPFFAILRHLKSQGIKPVIDIGPPPEALCAREGKPPRGPFDFHVRAPRDSAAYEKYFLFVRDLFLHLQGPGMFTREELEGWRYHLGREPDNKDAFDPAGRTEHLAAANLEEYRKLYDWTLAGMRAAGIGAVLDFGNLSVPHDGVFDLRGTWTLPLMDWLASGAPPLCPHLQGPRIRPGDTLCFSFTAYAKAQMGMDPRELGPMVRTVRSAALARFPRNPVLVTVGEGNIHYDDDSHRGDGTALGAAWNAAIAKVSLDEGLHRYQQWGFVSAPHISFFEEHGGLRPAAWNVVRMLDAMQGARRLPAKPASIGSLPSGSYVDAIAARRGKEFLVLAFHYNPERDTSGTGRALVRMKGLPSGRRFRATVQRVDRNHANYYTHWRRDLGASLLARGKFDALMEYQFTAAQRALWEANRERYRAASLLEEAPLEGAPDAADGRGELTLVLDLPANSVRLIRLVPR